MASFNKLPSGKRRAQVRARGQHVSRSFRLKSEAATWARESEIAMSSGKSLKAGRMSERTAFGALIDLHIDDMREVGKSPRRSKRKSLEKLKRDLGHVLLRDLTRERLITFGKGRAKEGAGAVTIGMDLGYIRTILVHATAIHGIATPTEVVLLARTALRCLGLIGEAKERDRRPTQDELDRIIDYADTNSRQTIPLGRIIKFAVATAMRLDEICRLRFEDTDLEGRIAVVRDRKDPRQTTGNHQEVPLLDANGYDPIQLIREELRPGQNGGRIFAYNSRSTGTAFRRACKELGIRDLHFHDLRHEATSRLFEACYDLAEVALVTGHKDWKMLRRYLNLKPRQWWGVESTREDTDGGFSLFLRGIENAWAISMSSSGRLHWSTLNFSDLAPNLSRLSSLTMASSRRRASSAWASAA
jgi:integrase